MSTIGNPSLKTVGRLGLVLFVLAAIAGVVLFHWTVNRVYVDAGQSLKLRYKGPLVFGSRDRAQPGQFAKVDEDGDPLEIGILEELKGPGRHFYCPIWWEREILDDVVVEPGEVMVVTSNLGDNLPAGTFLVEGELGDTTHKGILRKAYGPGRYRINKYAYQYEKVQTKTRMSGNQQKQSGWVSIPTGSVGVVTNLSDNAATRAVAGIQSKVLQPGNYLINHREQEVDFVEIGIREISIAVTPKLDAQGNPTLDSSGEPAIADDDSGITFPSSDGFPIHMDFTAIWGIMPDQASKAVSTFGTVPAVETKVVLPQIESICRNMGSQFKAAELLVGESREKFQDDTADAFRLALEGKNVKFQQGLVRYIYIPQEVRTPIQKGYIADELKLTRDQERLTAETEGTLREEEKTVELGAAKTKVETEKKVAMAQAEGQKTAQETKAETTKLIAAIDRKTAELETQAAVMLAEAESESQRMLKEAEAQKIALAVAAFGSGEAYNQWVFATGLPDDIQLDLLYAGEGTFWTDLKGFNEVMLSRQAQRELTPKKTDENVAPQTPAKTAGQR